MELIQKYYPDLDADKLIKLERFKELLSDWNSKINLISRKDANNFEINHLLHSISISYYFHFRKGDRILDVGTGGGLPGIPLAILFPDVSFTLIDSIGKKVMVVKDIIERLGLKNVKTKQIRVESFNESFDYVIARAVTAFPDFIELTGNRLSYRKKDNGIIYLKGGEFSDELTLFKKKVKVFNLKDIYSEAFFETKKIIYLPL